MSTQDTCTFCDTHVETLQEIIRHGTMRAVYPWQPIIAEHVMFVPLRHIASMTELSPSEAADLVAVVAIFKRAFHGLSSKTGFNVFENDGPEAGQHVPHVHFHMFGRAADEPVNPYHILNDLKNNPPERLATVDMTAMVAKLRSKIEPSSNRAVDILASDRL